MSALESWLSTNPALAAIAVPLATAIAFAVWSGILNAAGKKALDAGYPKAGAVLCWLATRTPPSSKKEALQLAKETAEEAGKP